MWFFVNIEPVKNTIKRQPNLLLKCVLSADANFRDLPVAAGGRTSQEPAGGKERVREIIGFSQELRGDGTGWDTYFAWRKTGLFGKHY